MIPRIPHGTAAERSHLSAPGRLLLSAFVAAGIGLGFYVALPRIAGRTLARTMLP